MNRKLKNLFQAFIYYVFILFYNAFFFIPLLLSLTLLILSLISSLFPFAPLLLLLKRSYSLFYPERAISNPKFGVYIMYIYNLSLPLHLHYSTSIYTTSKTSYFHLKLILRTVHGYVQAIPNPSAHV